MSRSPPFTRNVAPEAAVIESHWDARTRHARVATPQPTAGRVASKKMSARKPPDRIVKARVAETTFFGRGASWSRRRTKANGCRVFRRASRGKARYFAHVARLGCNVAPRGLRGTSGVWVISGSGWRSCTTPTVGACRRSHEDVLFFNHKNVGGNRNVRSQPLGAACCHP
jgi:hypothetical protein